MPAVAQMEPAGGGGGGGDSGAGGRCAPSLPGSFNLAHPSWQEVLFFLRHETLPGSAAAPAAGAAAPGSLWREAFVANRQLMLDALEYGAADDADGRFLWRLPAEDKATHRPSVWTGVAPRLYRKLLALRELTETAKACERRARLPRSDADRKRDVDDLVRLFARLRNEHAAGEKFAVHELLGGCTFGAGPYALWAPAKAGLVQKGEPKKQTVNDERAAAMFACRDVAFIEARVRGEAAKLAQPGVAQPAQPSAQLLWQEALKTAPSPLTQLVERLETHLAKDGKLQTELQTALNAALGAKKEQKLSKSMVDALVSRVQRANELALNLPFKSALVVVQCFDATQDVGDGDWGARLAEFYQFEREAVLQCSLVAIAATANDQDQDEARKFRRQCRQASFGALLSAHELLHDRERLLLLRAIVLSLAFTDDKTPFGSDDAVREWGSIVVQSVQLAAASVLSSAHNDAANGDICAILLEVSTQLCRGWQTDKDAVKRICKEASLQCQSQLADWEQDSASWVIHSVRHLRAVVCTLGNVGDVGDQQPEAGVLAALGQYATHCEPGGSAFRTERESAQSDVLGGAWLCDSIWHAATHAHAITPVLNGAALAVLPCRADSELRLRGGAALSIRCATAFEKSVLDDADMWQLRLATCQLHGTMPEWLSSGTWQSEVAAPALRYLAEGDCEECVAWLRVLKLCTEHVVTHTVFTMYPGLQEAAVAHLEALRKKSDSLAARFSGALLEQHVLCCELMGNVSSAKLLCDVAQLTQAAYATRDLFAAMLTLFQGRSGLQFRSSMVSDCLTRVTFARLQITQALLDHLRGGSGGPIPTRGSGAASELLHNVLYQSIESAVAGSLSGWSVDPWPVEVHVVGPISDASAPSLTLRWRLVEQGALVLQSALADCSYARVSNGASSAAGGSVVGQQVQLGRNVANIVEYRSDDRMHCLLHSSGKREWVHLDDLNGASLIGAGLQVGVDSGCHCCAEVRKLVARAFVGDEFSVLRDEVLRNALQRAASEAQRLLFSGNWRAMRSFCASLQSLLRTFASALIMHRADRLLGLLLSPLSLSALCEISSGLTIAARGSHWHLPDSWRAAQATGEIDALSTNTPPVMIVPSVGIDGRGQFGMMSVQGSGLRLLSAVFRRGEADSLVNHVGKHKTARFATAVANLLRVDIPQFGASQCCLDVLELVSSAIAQQPTLAMELMLPRRVQFEFQKSADTDLLEEFIGRALRAKGGRAEQVGVFKGAAKGHKDLARSNGVAKENVEVEDVPGESTQVSVLLMPSGMQAAEVLDATVAFCRTLPDDKCKSIHWKRGNLASEFVDSITILLNKAAPEHDERAGGCFGAQQQTAALRVLLEAMVAYAQNAHVMGAFLGTSADTDCSLFFSRHDESRGIVRSVLSNQDDATSSSSSSRIQSQAYVQDMLGLTCRILGSAVGQNLKRPPFLHDASPRPGEHLENIEKSIAGVQGLADDLLRATATDSSMGAGVPRLPVLLEESLGESFDDADLGAEVQCFGQIGVDLKSYVLPHSFNEECFGVQYDVWGFILATYPTLLLESVQLDPIQHSAITKVHLQLCYDRVVARLRKSLKVLQADPNNEATLRQSLKRTRHVSASGQSKSRLLVDAVHARETSAASVAPRRSLFVQWLLGSSAGDSAARASSFDQWVGSESRSDLVRSMHRDQLATAYCLALAIRLCELNGHIASSAASAQLARASGALAHSLLHPTPSRVLADLLVRERWAQLTPRQIEAARVLEYSQDSWDAGRSPPRWEEGWCKEFEKLSELLADSRRDKLPVERLWKMEVHYRRLNPIAALEALHKCACKVPQILQSANAAAPADRARHELLQEFAMDSILVLTQHFGGVDLLAPPGYSIAPRIKRTDVDQQQLEQSMLAAMESAIAASCQVLRAASTPRDTFGDPRETWGGARMALASIDSLARWPGQCATGMAELALRGHAHSAAGTVHDFMQQLKSMQGIGLQRWSDDWRQYSCARDVKTPSPRQITGNLRLTRLAAEFRPSSSGSGLATLPLTESLVSRQVGDTGLEMSSLESGSAAGFSLSLIFASTTTRNTANATLQHLRREWRLRSEVWRLAHAAASSVFRDLPLRSSGAVALGSPVDDTTASSTLQTMHHLYSLRKLRSPAEERLALQAASSLTATAQQPAVARLLFSAGVVSQCSGFLFDEVQILRVYTLDVRNVQHKLWCQMLRLVGTIARVLLTSTSHAAVVTPFLEFVQAKRNILGLSVVEGELPLFMDQERETVEMNLSLCWAKEIDCSVSFLQVLMGVGSTWRVREPSRDGSVSQHEALFRRIVSLVVAVVSVSMDVLEAPLDKNAASLSDVCGEALVPKNQGGGGGGGLLPVKKKPSRVGSRNNRAKAVSSRHRDTAANESERFESLKQQMRKKMKGDGSLKKLFGEFDENNDGVLSKREFRKGLYHLCKKLNVRVDPQQVLKFIDHIDKDSDDRIDYDEFVREFGGSDGAELLKPRSEKEKVWHGDGFAVKFSEKVHKRLTSAVLHGVSMLRAAGPQPIIPEGHASFGRELFTFVQAADDKASLRDLQVLLTRIVDFRVQVLLREQRLGEDETSRQLRKQPERSLLAAVKRAMASGQDADEARLEWQKVRKTLDNLAKEQDMTLRKYCERVVQVCGEECGQACEVELFAWSGAPGFVSPATSKPTAQKPMKVLRLHVDLRVGPGAKWRAALDEAACFELLLAEPLQDIEHDVSAVVASEEPMLFAAGTDALPRWLERWQQLEDNAMWCLVSHARLCLAESFRECEPAANDPPDAEGRVVLACSREQSALLADVADNLPRLVAARRSRRRPGDGRDERRSAGEALERLMLGVAVEARALKLGA